MAPDVSVLLVFVEEDGWADAAAFVVDPKSPSDFRDSPARESEVIVPADSSFGLFCDSGSLVTYELLAGDWGFGGMLVLPWFLMKTWLLGVGFFE